MAITRKEFLKGLLGITAVGVAAAACGDDETDDPTSASSSSSSAQGTGGNGSGGKGSGGDGTGGDGTGGMGQGGDGSGGGAGVCASDIANPSFDGPMHPHPLTIPAADIEAGVDKIYATGGGHSHDVTVTAADFTSLKDGNSVMITSSSGGQGPHDHTFTLSCG